MDALSDGDYFGVIRIRTSVYSNIALLQYCGLYAGKRYAFFLAW